jgi:hypothetical protein
MVLDVLGGRGIKAAPVGARKGVADVHVGLPDCSAGRPRLIAASSGTNGRNGWTSFTRAGDKASKSVDAFDRVRAARAFPKDIRALQTKSGRR